MRLAEFILRDMHAILAEWEAFAGSRLPAASRMTPLALRDHAQQMLQAVVKDLMTAQSSQEQAAKAVGRAPQVTDALETAAQTHGFLRAQSGFDIKQMASEYRALRASVLRLWTDACRPNPPNIDDMMRFNEAIDQALAESIAFFSDKVDEARNLLLGMLGHDMRTPLQSIQFTATYLRQLNAGEKVTQAASRLINSGARMKALLDELVEYNRAKLGLGIRVSPAEVDVAELFTDELQELRAAHPERTLILQMSGNTRGCWDGPRLQRLLGNLVNNAVKYGAKDAPVSVVVSDDKDQLRFHVKNSGQPIGQSTLDQLFAPLQRGQHHERKYDPDAGLGLGLYIAREIANAHGGEIQARSEGPETIFSVYLPRRVAVGPADAGQSGARELLQDSLAP
jgi:signal transduction histidine kinase